jgi:transposase-like protein
MRSFQEISAELAETFPDEKACCAYFVRHRWPDGVCCPRCGSARVQPPGPGKSRWNCQHCGKGGSYRFSHLAGTLFENTKIPLSRWFRLIRLLQDKPEMSILQIRDAMGLPSYKNAWYMSHRLHDALADREFCRIMAIDEPDFAFLMIGRDTKSATPQLPQQAEIAHPC